ncbi:YrrS family protein [Psychrobacillus psychrodurans]|uniref:YrrS family protein n=1 Tax=Psychrobacillus psychrodurans TaxID=126157 RepID=A0A9X3RAX8_9BACI|nr:YrrS family protein [Psychrobacillus psychrodurans]MCZ8534945.1 YrrS family protein [Psychrobacillus psychrodurans]
MPEKNTKFDTRLDQRNHKRKKNNILNILIGIVILLIIIVTVNLVTGDDEKESATTNTKTEQEENTENESKEQEKDKESEEVVGNSTGSTDSTSSSEETTSETEENESTETEENEGGTVTTEPSDETNVDSVVIDSGWQPVGTEQSGNHVSSYDNSSVDWDEKVKALAYAANLDTSNMYVKFIGNGGSPQKSIGTVTSKDGSEIYRISLEWIDGEGWKPTKKEILKTLE